MSLPVITYTRRDMEFISFLETGQLPANYNPMDYDQAPSAMIYGDQGPGWDFDNDDCDLVALSKNFNIPPLTATGSSFEISSSLATASSSAIFSSPQVTAVNDVNVPESTSFSSIQEARNSVRRQGTIPQDETFPMSVIDVRHGVGLLMGAMKSTKYAKDAQKVIEPFTRGRYGDKEIELTCWEVMDCLMTRQINAVSFTEAQKNRETGSFKARFDFAMVALKQYKSICKHLLDPKYVYTFVDNPEAAGKRVAANKTVNDKKKTQLEAGKGVLSSAPSPDAEMGGT
ncbi:hypothetical protein N7520_007517 [Penicillium odoratum]|uniref:uncharacterized protein n=1 Tax=Penicillium odoratum TaxID=1167516 RepID=UPI002546C116|nr:uncharacterized protein N7520_007517 [Penicillium odoratum]KAJ5760361.1 hypothetical protein N7520_007517 [Penicillium odoratum]